MFYAFGFDRIGVVVSDLYFVDPQPGPGQEGAERGVRIEVRAVEPGTPMGTIYAARPITVERPVWRGDLLETVAGPPGSFDRAHHHPAFDGWEPGHRVYVQELSADPLPWVAERLSDPDRLFAEAGLGPDDVGPDDAAGLRAAVPDIVAAVDRLLQGVRAGVLARAPEGEPVASARVSWL
jgi:hypothetical protein